jgi:hypothetical protein
MLLAFTDESYSDRHYYQAAFIIDQGDLTQLETLIEEAGRYAMGYGIAAGVEFHGNAIMSATKGWEPLGNNFKAKSAIFKHVLRRISALSAVLIIQGVDVKRLRFRYSYPESPHEITHKNLMDAIDRYAEHKGDKVSIYSDQIDTQQRLQTLFSQYQLLSTGGYSPRYLREIVSIEYVESHMHPGIQIVDLCAFLFRRFDEHIENSNKTREQVIEMWEILSPLIHPYHLPRVWRP